MANDEPLPDLDAWAGVVINASVIAEMDHLVRALRNASAEAFAQASEWIRRAAAVDTGALEQLYATDRGFTMTVAASGAGLEAVLSNRPDAVAHIRDQIAGFEFVLDMATGSRPFSAQSLRELHAVLTQSQTSFKVLTGGQLVERPLPHGAFKDQPNNPTRADGSMFAYADPLDVDPEIARDLTRADVFASWGAAKQAAFVHYAFVCIHPFADGNGRVARALASWPLYQALSCPLLIFADARDDYLDALESADRGDHQRFADFIATGALTGLRLLVEQTAAASGPGIQASLARLRRLSAQKQSSSPASVAATAEHLMSRLHRDLERQAQLAELLLIFEVRYGQPDDGRDDAWQAVHVLPRSLRAMEPLTGAEAVSTVRLDMQADAATTRFRLRTESATLVLTTAEIWPDISTAGSLRLETYARRLAAQVANEVSGRAEAALPDRQMRSRSTRVCCRPGPTPIALNGAPDISSSART